MESLDAYDVESENDSTNLYTAEAFSELNPDFEAQKLWIADEILMTKLLILHSDHCKNTQYHHFDEYLVVSNSSALQDDKETFIGVCIDTD